MYRTAHDHGCYVMAAMHNGGLALERVREWLNITWDEVYELIPQSPRGSNGVLFLPYVAGERTPYLDSELRAGWFNLSQATQRADLVRAALEGVALAIKGGLATLRDANHDVESFVLTGGGTGREIWRQMLSDVLGVELRASSELNPSARGAAMLGAGVGGIDLPTRDRSETDAEIVTPDPVAAADYERIYRLFDRAVRVQQEEMLR
jgi:xylulokinase